MPRRWVNKIYKLANFAFSGLQVGMGSLLYIYAKALISSIYSQKTNIDPMKDHIYPSGVSFHYRYKDNDEDDYLYHIQHNMVFDIF